MNQEYRTVETLENSYFSLPNRLRPCGTAVMDVFTALVRLGATQPSKATPTPIITHQSGIERSQLHKALNGPSGKGRPGFVKVINGNGSPNLWYFNTDLMRDPNDFSPELLNKAQNGLVPTAVAPTGLTISSANNSPVEMATNPKYLPKGRGINKPEFYPPWEKKKEWFDLIDFFFNSTNPKRVLAKPLVLEASIINQEQIKAAYSKEQIAGALQRLNNSILEKDINLAVSLLGFIATYINHLIEQEEKNV